MDATDAPPIARRPAGRVDLARTAAVGRSGRGRSWPLPDDNPTVRSTGAESKPRRPPSDTSDPNASVGAVWREGSARTIPLVSVHGTERHLAIYTGSFDPVTLGHLDVLRRVRGMFDEIVLAIGRNPDKQPLFTMEERATMARLAIEEGLDDSAGIRVDAYEGLTVDYAREVKACAIIRGIRNVTDLAGESQLAITNRKVAGIETVFIVSGEEHAYTSSSLIRQMAALGATIDQLSSFVPEVVLDAIREKQSDPEHPLGTLRRDQVPD